MFAPPVKATKPKGASHAAPSRAPKPPQHFSWPPRLDAAKQRLAIQLALQQTISNQAGSLTGDRSDDYHTQEANTAPTAGWDLSRVPTFAPGRTSRPQTSPLLIQPRLTVGQVKDPLEQEADRIADQMMRMPVPDVSIPAGPQQISRKRDACEEGLQVLQTKPAGPQAPTSKALSSVHEVLRSPGQPLDAETRAYFEPRFGHDFSGVRVHTDSVAAAAARAVWARAYTIGRDVVFASREYAPATPEGKRLLAHELAHVVQQRQRPSQGILMRQPAPAQQVPVRPTIVEAAEFLEEMARFIEGARSFALSVMGLIPQAPATPAARRQAHKVLNQQRLRDMLANARRVFAVQEPALQLGSPDGTRLRAALLGVVAKIREVAPVALGISNGMPPPTPDNERNTNAELMVELIEADPFTSAGLVGTPAFGAAETAVGRSHEAFIEAYLDDLIRTLPGQTLAAAARDRILERVSAGLRRAFLTVGAGVAGTLDVREITNPSIVGKYRRVIELLSAAMSTRPAQLSIITDSLPAYVLPPDPVPDVTPQLQASPNIGAVDFSRVPASELPYVRYGVLQAANTVFAVGSTIQRQNASWPVALHVRRGVNIVEVRYDLIFDANSNVRIERLGEAGPRDVAPAFAQLSVAGKKAQLIADFGLAAVDDRPAAGVRPAAAWSPAELDQVKAAYDLIPVNDRPALRGVTIIRDHQGPPAAIAGQVLGGVAHTSASAAHDQPGPPAHGPPHIHYYDAAFTQNAVASVGPPGNTGPGGDWTIAHEVGHMRIFLALRQANAAVAAANAQIVAANAGVPALNAPLPPAQHQLRQAYSRARSAANNAIHALNAAAVAIPLPAPAQRAQLLQAAQAAVAARNQARANLAAGGVPAAMVQAATNLDNAMDALLTATLSIGAAQNQIPTFIALSGSFSFTPFTDYARRGGNDEFFAETYALFLTDPSRLSAMNRSIFLWFEAGMPMNPGWRPPP